MKIMQQTVILTALVTFSVTASAGLFDSIASQVGKSVMQQKTTQQPAQQPVSSRNVVVDGVSVNLERVQLTDNQLSCGQIKSQVDMMDVVMTRGETATAATQGGGDSTGVAGEAASAAATHAAARSGFAQYIPLAGQLASATVSGTDSSPENPKNNSPVTSQHVTAAGARKERLVEMYLDKGC